MTNGYLQKPDVGDAGAFRPAKSNVNGENNKPIWEKDKPSNTPTSRPGSKTQKPKNGDENRGK